MQRLLLYEFVTGGGFLGDGRGWPPESLLREGAAMAGALAADLAAIGVEVVVLRDDRLGDSCAGWDKRNAGPPNDATGSGAFFRAGVDAAYRADASRRQETRLMAPSRAPGGPALRLSHPTPCPEGVSCRVVRSAEEERAAVAELAAACDGTIVIAPELSNALLERCRWVEMAGGKLLGPGPTIVALASDKHATVEHLTEFGVPAPKGWLIGPGGTVPSDAGFPAVGKPCLGAGSQGVRLLADREAAKTWAAGLEGPGRLERFCPGVAASVAVLCGPAGVFPLVPCRQRLSGDGHFAYQGGSLPLEPPLAQRAIDLAVRSVATLPGAVGYLGVDLVLGPDPDGREDVAIEINPRLTTSYVGLRAAAAPDVNLAAAILAVCEGRVPRLSFLPVEVQFEPDGSVL